MKNGVADIPQGNLKLKALTCLITPPGSVMIKLW
jgi:hypothetical protein